MSSQSQALLKPTTSSISATRLLTSFAASALPISLLLKLRWHSRFGLDHLHLILIHLLFFILATRFSPRHSTPSRSACAPRPVPSVVTETQKPKRSGRLSRQQAETPDELHERTVRNLLEVIEPSLLPPSTDASSPQAGVNLKDWTPVFPVPDRPLSIRHHPNIASLYAVRITLDKIDAERLIRCLSEKKQWEWDRMCECGGELGGKVSWVRLKGSWPIKPKQMVMYSTAVRLSPAAPLRVLFASTSTTHALKHSDASVKYAGCLVEPAPADSASSQLTLIVDLSGFGNLPTFIIKTILTKYIPASLKALGVLARNLPANTTPLTLPPLWNPSSGPSETEAEKTDEPLRELVQQLKQLLGILSSLHRPPTVAQTPSPSAWADRAWFWAGSAGLMMSSGIALKIINRSREQQYRMVKIPKG